MRSDFVLLPNPKPDLIFKALPEGGLLYSPDHEVYFSLNAVGAKVWSLLPPTNHTMDEIVTHLSGVYREVSPEIIRADVTDLLKDFLANDLVVAANGARPGV